MPPVCASSRRKTLSEPGGSPLSCVHLASARFVTRDWASATLAANRNSISFMATSLSAMGGARLVKMRQEVPRQFVAGQQMGGSFACEVAEVANEVCLVVV